MSGFALALILIVVMVITIIGWDCTPIVGKLVITDDGIIPTIFTDTMTLPSGMAIPVREVVSGEIETLPSDTIFFVAILKRLQIQRIVPRDNIHSALDLCYSYRCMGADAVILASLGEYYD